MENEKRNIQIDYNHAVMWFQSNDSNLKELALLAFPELAKPKLPKTWEELGYIEGYYVDADSYIDSIDTSTADENRNIFKTKGQAEASIALAQLSQLRDVYRNGWLPDWSGAKSKFCIIFKKELSIYESCNNTEFLSFQSKEIAEEFLNNFAELITKAKPLMS